MTESKSTGLFSETDQFSLLEKSERLVRVSIWWIRCRHWEPEYRFVYLCVYPSKGRVSKTWSKSDIDEKPFIFVGGESSKRKIVKRHICLPGNTAHELIRGLASDSSIEAVCAGVGIDSLDVNPTIPLSPESEWKMIMPVFFPEENSLTFLLPIAKGRQSPMKDTGCYCTRIVSPNSLRFLEDEEEPDKVIDWISDVLRKETGLDFMTTGGEALGNIEIYGFPSLDDSNHSKVSVGFEKDNEKRQTTVKLELTGGDFPSEMTAQIRSEILNDVSSDQLIGFDPETCSADVILPEPLDGVTIRIWKDQKSGKKLLWHEKTWIFVREISMSANLIGLRGTLGAPWLEELSGTRARARAEAFRKITQVSSDIPMAVSMRSSWEKEVIAKREAFRRLNPERSEGRFFKKGWAGDTKLDFAEWLKDKLSKQKGRILLTDPYFDVVGLDLLSRASGAAKEITVLTCTQTPSDDDEGGANKRVERLGNAFKEALPILQGLKLNVLDLRSKEDGKSRLFHDRYLLMYDENNDIKEGYNLSTSLQSATRKTTLLATPIPKDVLDDVADYVRALLSQGEEDEDKEIIKLFPGPRIETSIAEGISPQDAKSAMKFLEILLNTRIGTSGNDSKNLDDAGLLNKEKTRIDVAWNKTDLERIQNHLETAGIEESALVWEGAVFTAMSHWYNELPDLLNEMMDENPPVLGDMLVHYLIGQASGALQTDGSEDHVRTLAHYFAEESFLQSLKVTSNFYNYHHELPLGTSWPIHAAARCIGHHYPEKVGELIRELLSLGQDSQSILSALATALWCTVREAEESVVQCMASSRVPFVRALAAIHVWEKLRRDEITWEDFQGFLFENLQNEADEILASALYDLRIEANRRNSRNLRAEIPLHEEVVELLVQELKKKSSLKRLVRLMPSFSGPLNGDWAGSTHAEIVLPLMEHGKIDPVDVYELWNTIFEDVVVGSTFFSGRSGELIDTWGGAFWLGNKKQKSELLSHAKVELTKKEGLLYAPFLRSRDYESWQKTTDGILLWMIRLWVILENQPEEKEEETIGEVKSLCQIALRIVDEEKLVESAIQDIQTVSKAAKERLVSHFGIGNQ